MEADLERIFSERLARIFICHRVNSTSDRRQTRRARTRRRGARIRDTPRERIRDPRGFDWKLGVGVCYIYDVSYVSHWGDVL